MIFKYPLNREIINETQLILMPVDARVLSAAAQGDDICIWAEVENDSPCRMCGFAIMFTGVQEPGGGMDHLATIQRGGYVLHVYVERRAVAWRSRQ